MNNTNNVSQTAMLIASLRALSCYEIDPLIHGDDYMAEMFLPDEKRIPLKTTEYRPAIKKAIPDGLYEYVIARTKYFDELFLHCLNLQIPQIVLLGAGFDSRAYRSKNQINHSCIYEVDTPATQEIKLQILKENDVQIHNNVKYIAADLEKNELFINLCRAGFQNSRQTLYILEGVTFYLTPRSMKAMLISLKQHSSSGSILSFDFQHQDGKISLIDTELEDEKIKFGINADQCSQYLQSYGYSIIEKIDSEEICNRYLVMTDGTRFGNVKSIMNIVKSKVN